MRDSWRIGLVLGLAALSGGTAANAQSGGAAPNAQVGGAAAQAQNGGNLNGGLSGPVEKDAEHKDSTTSKPAPAQRRTGSFFDRVTTVRQEAVPSSPPAAVSGVKSQTDPLRPRNAQAMQTRKPSADPHVSAGSSWHQESERPASPTRGTVRSTTHNYFPGMRLPRQPNANAAPVASAGRGRTRVPAGQAQAARNGQRSTPSRGQSSSGPAGRR